MKWLENLFGNKTPEEVKFELPQHLEDALKKRFEGCGLVLIIKHPCDDATCSNDHIAAVHGLGLKGRSELNKVIIDTALKVNRVSFGAMREAAEKLMSEINSKNNEPNNERRTETKPPRIRRPKNRRKANQK